MAKFYICRHCGNLAYIMQDGGVNPVCCGSKMEELHANSTDAATEKHVPVVTVEGDTVKVVVGSVVHPMTPEHLIQWIFVETEKGGHFKKLTPEDAPEAVFNLNGEKAVAVYEYCNLHGLWVTNL